MKKKLLILVVLAMVVAGGAFAAPEFKLSAGGGAFFGSDFGGGFKASMMGESMSVETPYFGGGVYGFFDLTYAELSIGYFMGQGKMKAKGMSDDGDDSSETSKLQSLNFGVLLKYPFQISEKFTIFPLLGIDYQSVLSAKIDGKDIDEYTEGEFKAKDFSALWFKFGAGADLSLTDQIYLRLNLLYGIRTENKFEKDMKDRLAILSLLGGKTETILGHGLTAKVAVGFKF